MAARAIVYVLIMDSLNRLWLPKKAKTDRREFRMLRYTLSRRAANVPRSPPKSRSDRR